MFLAGSEEFFAIVDDPFWPVEKPGDDALRTGHTLSPYFVAAQAKRLPTNYFRDIIRGRGNVSVRRADNAAPSPLQRQRRRQNISQRRQNAYQ